MHCETEARSKANTIQISRPCTVLFKSTSFNNHKLGQGIFCSTDFSAGRAQRSITNIQKVPHKKTLLKLSKDIYTILRLSLCFWEVKINCILRVTSQWLTDTIYIVFDITICNEACIKGLLISKQQHVSSTTISWIIASSLKEHYWEINTKSRYPTPSENQD